MRITGSFNPDTYIIETYAYSMELSIRGEHRKMMFFSDFKRCSPSLEITPLTPFETSKTVLAHQILKIEQLNPALYPDKRFLNI